MNRRGRSRSQILYWFRTPPNVKVGREPFDTAVRQALEAQYPHLRFDWPRLLDIHIPPPEVEEWRERRRAARAAKQAAEIEDAEAAAERREDTPGESVPSQAVPSEVIPAIEAASTSDAQDESASTVGQAGQVGQVGNAGLDPNRRRRRRRRGRRGGNPQVPGSSVPGSGFPVPPSASEAAIQAAEPNHEPANSEPNQAPGTTNQEP